MQQDHVLNKLKFDLLNPRVGGGGVCRQNICYHFAALIGDILFNMQYVYVLKKLYSDT